MQPRRIIDSPLSRTIEQDGVSFEIGIYRLEDTDWSLSIVTPDRTMITWDQPFASDRDALNEALETLSREGAEAFVTPSQPALEIERR